MHDTFPHALELSKKGYNAFALIYRPGAQTAWLGSYGTMEERIRRQGTNAEIEIFDGLPHGFGLGEGTVAEGWFDRAVWFWEDNI